MSIRDCNNPKTTTCVYCFYHCWRCKSKIHWPIMWTSYTQCSYFCPTYLHDQLCHTGVILLSCKAACTLMPHQLPAIKNKYISKEVEFYVPCSKTMKFELKYEIFFLKLNCNFWNFNTIFTFTCKSLTTSLLYNIIQWKKIQ